LGSPLLKLAKKDMVVMKVV